MQNNRVTALILAGGRVGELSVLTLRRPKSAMPFGGMYRVIDCALSNLADSRIDHIGILSQYRPASLMDHVGSGAHWDLVGTSRGVRFLPPHTGTTASDWYKGTADALYQNLTYIRSHKPDRVLIVSGDHVYRMNYGPLFDLHEKTGAEATIAVTPVPSDLASRFGLVTVDSDGRVKEYYEKPEKPVSNLASMTVYVFETDVLIRELQKNAVIGKTYQIYDGILPALARKGTLSAYVFEDYWSYSRSIDDYYHMNMDCLDESNGMHLAKWKLNTKPYGTSIGDYPPALIGSNANIQNSIISPGCHIQGEVINSILSPMVNVQKGARVVDSILFDEVNVGGNTYLDRVISDKKVLISPNVKIGKAKGQSCEANNEVPHLLNSGFTILGRKSRIAESVCIGGNVIVYPDVSNKELSGKEIPDGSTIHS